jgi:hypothetical protein
MWKNLHDPAMLLMHMISTLLLVLQATLTLRLSFFLGLWDSLARLPTIVSKRRLEKRAIQVKDHKIQKLFLEFKKQSFILLK